MDKLSFRELATPLINSIDSFNYLLKYHHRRTAIISYNLGKILNLTKNQMADLVIAASLHDIGALSVQERDQLIQEDVKMPAPHCLMGYKMMSSCDLFKNEAQIIKHHHIRYDKRNEQEDTVTFQSHILHLADRADIYSLNSVTLNKRSEVIHKIRKKVGTVFHPDVFNAFWEVAKTDKFWDEINDLSMEGLFDRVHFSRDKVMSSEEMVQFAIVISRIVDFKSRFTASHSYTVGHLAYQIGKMLDLEDKICTDLLIAGLLHDIGKIAIDPHLIEKNGPLKEEEFKQVKLHPYYTGQILRELKTSNSFKEIVYWAEHHHEKIDGSGYPYGSKGDELDLGTKILAYSDIISALMEDRPYRKKIAYIDAFKIIEEKFSKKLDPVLYLKLNKNKKQIDKIVSICHQESLELYSK